MNDVSTEEVFWKLENGEKILLTELNDEHFKAAYIVTQKRQIRAFSTLEMCVKLEDAMLKIAKKRGIELESIENSNKSEYLRNRFTEFKDIIGRINRSIKLRLSKNAKARKAVLQDSDTN